ncbi:MAG: hypothetical protein L0Y76_05130, partial [Ignavibacteria bacterium]|nr:hypothetical protein [Ignavibacteria bacterium]
MRKKILLLLLTACFIIPSVRVSAQFSGQLKSKIDEYVKEYASNSKSVFITLVTDADGNKHYSGYDGRNNQPVTDFSAPFEIGSCS